MNTQSGHLLIEAIITSALIITIGAGLWQITRSASSLASRALIATQPPCQKPRCSDGPSSETCVCGEETFTLLK